MHLLTLKTILVAADRDGTSLACLQGGAALAAASGAALHVVHVTDDAGVTSESLADSAFHGIDARIHVASGDPADAIRAVADRLRADVIVLGPHRNTARAVSGPTFGSTALGVVTNAAAPCLVIAESLRLPLHRVLVPVDLSDTSRGALLVGLSWASALRPTGGRGPAELAALYVGTTSKSPAGGTDRLRALEGEVAEIRKVGGSWAGVDVRSTAVEGNDPAAAITRHAREHDVELVVLGTRGLGLDPVGRLGSVAGDTVRQLHLPILLVPPAIWLAHARTS